MKKRFDTVSKVTFQTSVVQNLDSAIHWIEIYPVDRVIHLLNNWDLQKMFYHCCGECVVLIRRRRSFK